MSVWKKLFSKITFKNYPDTSTPINADNLNAMTDAIDGIDDRVVELNSNLEGLSDVSFENLGKVTDPNAYATGNYTGWIQIGEVQYTWLQFDGTTFQSQIAIANGTGAIIQRTKIHTSTWADSEWKKTVSELESMSAGGRISGEGDLYMYTGNYKDKWLTTVLDQCIYADGRARGTLNIDNADAFYSGITLAHYSTTANLPVQDWCLLISAGTPGTVQQLAISMWTGEVFYRYCASATWSVWKSLYIPKYELPVGSIVLGENLSFGYGTWSQTGYVDFTYNDGAITKIPCWKRTA